MSDYGAKDRMAWPAKIMVTRWAAMPNDVIGGWCVMAGDIPPSRAREPEVADFVTQEAAEHIAGLHNKWLDAAGDLTRTDAEDPR